MSQLAKIRIEEGSQLRLQVRILIALSGVPELCSVRHLCQDRLESAVLRREVIQQLCNSSDMFCASRINRNKKMNAVVNNGRSENNYTL